MADTMTIRIPADLRTALERHAATQGKTLSELARQALERELGRNPLEDQITDHERRLRELERIAGV